VAAQDASSKRIVYPTCAHGLEALVVTEAARVARAALLY